MKYGKFRVVIGKYDVDDLPNTIAVNGKVYNNQDDAKINAIAMIKDLFDRRFTTNICPGMGYDPLKYELDTKGPAPIIYYNPSYGTEDRIPVFNVTWHHVICDFTSTVNRIDYRAMRITKYLDKWYVQSKFGYQIIGIIDDMGSINDICAEADKIWESHKDDSTTVTLTDN